MEKFGGVADLRADVLEDGRDRVDVEVFVEREALIAAFGTIALVGANEAAASVPAFAELDADVAVAALHRFGDVLGGLFLGPPADVVVAGNGVVRLAAEHLEDGHAGALALDVPERFVEGAEDLVVDRSVAPVRLEMGALPKVFDAVGIFADDPGFEVLLEGGDYGLRLIVVVGRSDAVESRLARDYLEEYPAVVPSGAGRDHLDVFDGERRQTLGPAPDFLRGGHREGWCGENSLDQISTIHVPSSTGVSRGERQSRA